MKKFYSEMTLEEIVKLKCRRLRRSRLLDDAYEKKLFKENNRCRLIIFANKYSFPGSDKLIERLMELGSSGRD